ncbi:unnamed protein product [Lota lota]
MELHCLPTETPTPSSRGSTDRLYDNCPPYSLQRGRERYGESGTAGPSVPAGGLPALPRGPWVGLVPAEAHIPTLSPGVGGSGSGAWPDHSYCSWAWGSGRQGWGAEGRWRNYRAVGVGLGGGGQEGESCGEGEEMDSPSPAHSVEHESALSVYDNLHEGTTPDDLATPMETSIPFPCSEEDCFLLPYSEEEIRLLTTEAGDASRDSSLWSSCEIILAGSRCSDGPAPDQLGGPEERASEALTASMPHSSQTGLLDQDQRPPGAGADSSPDQGPPHGARVPPPLPLADPMASALRSVLTGLQHQIGRQRDEYEARISSLEQRNEELQSQLLGLRANLSQQRRWYQAVQAKIQESERARAAAETRNATIQREMDQFFDTFGELNNEARKAERIVRSF